MILEAVLRKREGSWAFRRRQDLWNEATSVRESYRTDGPHQAAILEQYKLYVERADRISARRALANTLFGELVAEQFAVAELGTDGDGLRISRIVARR